MQRTIIEFWTHVEGLLSTQEARVAPPFCSATSAYIHNSMVVRGSIFFAHFKPLTQDPKVKVVN